MKKKFLSTLFKGSLVLSGVLLLGSCSCNDKPVYYSVDISPALEQHWINVDATGSFTYESGTDSNKYSFTLKDTMDVDTLKIFANGVEIPVTKNSDFIEPVEMKGEYISIGTFQVKNISENTVVTFECQPRTINYKFELKEGTSLPQSGTKEFNLLNNAVLQNDGDPIQNYTLYTMLATNKEFSINIDDYARILFETVYLPGTVEVEEGFLSENYLFVYAPSEDKLNMYCIDLWQNNYQTAVSTLKEDNLIVLDPTKIDYGSLTYEKPEGNMIKVNGENTNVGFIDLNTEGLNIVIDTSVEGINFETAVLKLNGTPVMGVGTEAGIITNSNNTLSLTKNNIITSYGPIKYGGLNQSYSIYYITLEDVTYENEQLYYINVENTQNPDYVFYPENNMYLVSGDHYAYKASDYPLGYSHSYTYNDQTGTGISVEEKDGTITNKTIADMLEGNATGEGLVTYTVVEDYLTFIMEYDTITSSAFSLKVIITTPGQYTITFK